MPVRIYTSIDELPESYNGFFDQIGENNFFFSQRWFRNFSETALESNARVRLYAVESNGPDKLPLTLLITRTPAGQNGSIFNGWGIGESTLASMTSFQSVEFAPLISPLVKDPSALLCDLVAAICEERPRWSLIDLNLLDPQASWVEPMKNQFKKSGMIVRSYIASELRFEATNGRSYHEFLKTRPDTVRRDCPRRRKKLEERHNVHFKIVKNGAELEAALSDYEKVLAASWKDPEEFPKFTKGLVYACAASGTLLLGLLYVDEEPAAAQIWIVSGGRVSIYKPSFDERFRHFSVATILTAYLMEHVFDVEKVREVDFGLSDAPYKKAWLSQLREVHGLVAFNPRTLRGGIALLQFELRRMARSILKEVKATLKQKPRRSRNPSRSAASSLITVVTRIVKNS